MTLAETLNVAREIVSTLDELDLAALKAEAGEAGLVALLEKALEQAGLTLAGAASPGP